MELTAGTTAFTSDVGAGSDTILPMLSGVTLMSSMMTPSTSELNVTLAGKRHRGFQPRRTDLHRGRSRRRPRSHRGFTNPMYELTSNRWDQQNRLVRVLEGAHESVYEYDGESHRTRIKELTSSVETKNETFVWCGTRICQKRASNGSTVVRNYFREGFEENGTGDYFYTRDHLGSVREVIGSDGITIASKVSCDPWGEITETGSGALSNFAYTGHHYDRPTGLSLAWYRGYYLLLGRWLSRDPIGLKDGLHLYAYVEGDPANRIDLLGQEPTDRCSINPFGPCQPPNSWNDWGCRRHRCPDGIKKSCVDRVEAAFQQCVNTAMSQGKSFSEAVVGCGHLKSDGVEQCLRLLCPP